MLHMNRKQMFSYNCRFRIPLKILPEFYSFTREQQCCEMEIPYNGNETAVFPGFVPMFPRSNRGTYSWRFPPHPVRRRFANTGSRRNSAAISLASWKSARLHRDYARGKKWTERESIESSFESSSGATGIADKSPPFINHTILQTCAARRRTR